MADQAESGSGAPGSTEDVGGAPPHAGYISGAPAAAQQPTEPDTGPALVRVLLAVAPISKHAHRVHSLCSELIRSGACPCVCAALERR